MIHFTGCTSPTPVPPVPSPHQGDSGFSLGVDVDKQTPENPCWGGREMVGSRTTHELETGWDLGLGILCFSACTWTNISCSNKIQRNYKGLKITESTAQLGQIMNNKNTKRPKTQLPLLRSQGQKQGTGNAPCTENHQRGGQTT